MGTPGFAAVGQKCSSLGPPNSWQASEAGAVLLGVAPLHPSGSVPLQLVPEGLSSVPRLGWDRHWTVCTPNRVAPRPRRSAAQPAHSPGTAWAVCQPNTEGPCEEGGEPSHRSPSPDELWKDQGSPSVKLPDSQPSAAGRERPCNGGVSSQKCNVVHHPGGTGDNSMRKTRTSMTLSLKDSEKS